MLRLGMLSPADFLQDVPRAQAGARGSQGDTRGFLRLSSTFRLQVFVPAQIPIARVCQCPVVSIPTPVRNASVKSHAQASQDKASSHSCPFYWGAPNLSEHRVAHRLEGPAVLLIPHKAAVYLAQPLAPRSKPRPTKVRPEWWRAGFTGARGCPGRHLGAASLGQLV